MKRSYAAILLLVAFSTASAIEINGLLMPGHAPDYDWRGTGRYGVLSCDLDEDDVLELVLPAYGIFRLFDDTGARIVVVDPGYEHAVVVPLAFADIVNPNHDLRFVKPPVLANINNDGTQIVGYFSYIDANDYARGVLIPYEYDQSTHTASRYGAPESMIGLIARDPIPLAYDFDRDGDDEIVLFGYSTPPPHRHVNVW